MTLTLTLTCHILIMKRHHVPTLKVLKTDLLKQIFRIDDDDYFYITLTLTLTLTMIFRQTFINIIIIFVLFLFYSWSVTLTCFMVKHFSLFDHVFISHFSYFDFDLSDRMFDSHTFSILISVIFLIFSFSYILIVILNL